jgi:hypothetical protein
MNWICFGVQKVSDDQKTTAPKQFIAGVLTPWPPRDGFTRVCWLLTAWLALVVVVIGIVAVLVRMSAP